MRISSMLWASMLVLINDQWRVALDAAEAALLNCAVQVHGCIKRQEAPSPEK